MVESSVLFGYVADYTIDNQCAIIMPPIRGGKNESMETAKRERTHKMETDEEGGTAQCTMMNPAAAT
jgi:hypothetical protein